MHAHVVVDSCVAYKWFYRTDEPGLDRADALLERHLDGSTVLVAPTIMPVELCNALRYSGLPDSRVREVVELIEAATIALYHTTYTRLDTAVRLARDHGLSVYDALFLGLAAELDCPLVTSDRRAFGTLESPVEIVML